MGPCHCLPCPCSLLVSPRPAGASEGGGGPSGEAVLELKAAINIVCTVLLTKLRCVTLMDDYNRYLHSDDVVFHLLLRLSYVIQAPRGVQGGERGLVRRCIPSLSAPIRHRVGSRVSLSLGELSRARWNFIVIASCHESLHKRDNNDNNSVFNIHKVIFSFNLT